MIRNKYSWRSVLVAVLALAGFVASAAGQNASKMSQYQSFMKTANTNLSVGTSLVSAFASTPVTCPASHTAGCTVRVQVSTQFSMRCCMQGNFRIKVLIPGSGSQIWPNSLVNVAMMGGGMMASGDAYAQTFHWMKTGIPAGATQNVTIQFQTDAGTGTAGYRIATVDCYLN